MKVIVNKSTRKIVARLDDARAVEYMNATTFNKKLCEAVDIKHLKDINQKTVTRFNTTNLYK